MNAWMWNNDDRLCQHTTAMIQPVCVGLSCELHCRAYCMHNFYAKDPTVSRLSILVTWPILV